MKLHKSTIQLLRIPFSINLLPIFLFAIYNAKDSVDWLKCLLVFLLIHFVFYPASNAYNSYMDDDEGSIAGVEQPLKPTKQLFYVSIFLDAIGLAVSYFISLPFLLINLLLVLLSRAYSYRRIRLKKYPILGFLMVAISQGALSYLNMKGGIVGSTGFEAIFTLPNLFESLVALLFVGAIYPITQIYQHEEDTMNGDRTISILLGFKGTFVLSGLLFILSNIIIARLITIQELKNSRF